MSPQKRRTIALPIAMLIGVIFHKFFDSISFLTPYLIFSMLFATFCRVSIKEMKFTRMHWVLFGVQVIGGIAIYCALMPINKVLAQGAMICFMAPCATAATAIAGMLGANVSLMASFCLLNNMGVAFVAPIMFSVMGAVSDLPFYQSVLIILSKVVPLLIGPFLLAIFLESTLPKLHKVLRDKQSIAFWLWALSLTVVMGRTVEFIMAQPSSNYVIEIVLALIALVICLFQFIVGRRIGRKYGDTVAGGQSLGQKNTVLAIWMAQTWLDPISSIAPAAYVVWQNIVNSWQLWRYKEAASEKK